MEYKLAKADFNSEAKIVTLEEVEGMLKSDRETIIYFDRDNSEKALNKLAKHFDEKDKSVYIREVRFGLDEKDSLYEIHIL
jgi:hypothetical protein